MVIPKEARRITHSTKIRNLKKGLNLSNLQKEIIIGALMGDAHLELNWSNVNYKLSFSHSLKQKDYIFWKYHLLKDWTLSKPVVYEKTKSISFRTLSHPELTALSRLFYRDGKKIVPDITLLQSPLTLAVWFMDDGNIIRRNNRIYGFHLNTQSFSQEDNLKLIDFFKNSYNIRAKLELNHGRYRLRIMEKESRSKLVSIIQPHVIESMYYKIS